MSQPIPLFRHIGTFGDRRIPWHELIRFNWEGPSTRWQNIRGSGCGNRISRHRDRRYSITLCARASGRARGEFLRISLLGLRLGVFWFRFAMSVGVIPTTNMQNIAQIYFIVNSPHSRVLGCQNGCAVHFQRTCNEVIPHEFFVIRD
jgi:hypothetical protein